MIYFYNGSPEDGRKAAEKLYNIGIQTRFLSAVDNRLIIVVSRTNQRNADQ